MGCNSIIWDPKTRMLHMQVSGTLVSSKSGNPRRILDIDNPIIVKLITEAHDHYLVRSLYVPNSNYANSGIQGGLEYTPKYHGINARISTGDVGINFAFSVYIAKI